MNILIIGGTKFIGRAITKTALAAGHQVTLFNRGVTAHDIAGVEHIRGDVDQLADYQGMLREQSFDAVVHCIAYTEQHGHDLRQVFQGTKTRIALLSSIDCYEAWQGLNRRKDLAELPVTEASPVSSTRYYWSDTDTKGDMRHTYDKSLLTDIVMAGCAEEEYEATTFRLPLVWGPDDYQIMGRHGDFIRRIIDDRPTIILSGREQCQVYTYGYIDNLAAAIIHSLPLPQCCGKIYNIGEEKSRSRRRWLELYGATLGFEFDVHILPEELIRGDRAYRHAPPQHLLVGTGLFNRDTGFAPPVALPDAIRATFSYAERHPDCLGPQPDYGAEDDLIQRYEAALDSL